MEPLPYRRRLYFALIHFAVAIAAAILYSVLFKNALATDGEERFPLTLQVVGVILLYSCVASAYITCAWIKTASRRRLIRAPLAARERKRRFIAAHANASRSRTTFFSRRIMRNPAFRATS